MEWCPKKKNALGRWGISPDSNKTVQHVLAGCDTFIVCATPPMRALSVKIWIKH